MDAFSNAAPRRTKEVRGIRNNNPGNIEWGSPWQGLVAHDQRSDPRFAQFVDPVWGIRALTRVLITYQDKRRAKDGSPIDTVAEFIERWAPAFENNTQAYTGEVCKAVSETTGREVCGAKPYTHDDVVSLCMRVSPANGDIVTPDSIIDIHDYDVAFGLVSGIIRHENGRGPLKTLNTWYTDEQITEGLRRAGIVKPVASRIPVTKETVGAATAGAAGAAQLADVVPHVLTAMDKAHGDISSGDWIRVAFGVAVVAGAAYVAWAQLRRHRVGAL